MKKAKTVFQIKAYNTRKGWFGNYTLIIQGRAVLKCYYSQGYEKNSKCTKDIDFSITVNEKQCKEILSEHCVTDIIN
jgi:hypothetical protein